VGEPRGGGASLVAAFLLAAALLLPAPRLFAGERELLAQADALAARGKFSAAAALLLTAERNDAAAPGPRLAAARILRDAGYYFLDNGLFGEALKAAKAALEIRPDLAEARYRTAVLLYEGARYGEAGAVFGELATSPDAGAFPSLAAYRRASGRFAELVAKHEEEKKQGKAGEKGPDPAKTKPDDTCDLCWKPLSGEVVQLEDGRRRCVSCAAGAIYEEEELAGIRAKVTATLDSSLGLRFPKAVSSHLVSKDEMRRLAGEFSGFKGVTPEDLAGLFTVYTDRLAIYVLRGLPRIETLRVLAHEMAHGWEAQQCPPGVSLGAKEGFAEWVAYRTLLAEGQQEEAGLMFLEPGPYGVHFKRFEVIGRILGPEKTIAQMQEGRF
jgi:hypothetical protein